MDRPDRRFVRSDALCLGGLLLIVFLLMGPAWSQPEGLWYRSDTELSDLTASHWPKWWSVVQTWRQYRQIPLWMPLTMGGAPYVGNPLSAYFYPPNWLILFLPVTLAFNLLFALHMFVGGAAMYGLVRWSYRRTSFAAFLAGLSYALTPKLVAYVASGHMGLSQAFAWLPLTLWLLRSALEQRRGRLAAWCGASLALTYFADPRVAFYSVLLTGGYALYRLIGSWRSDGARVAFHLALRLLLVPTTFFLVGAVQILPTVEMMTATTRSTLTLAEAGHDSLPWRYLIGFLIADRGGYHEWMTYLGLVPLGLAVLALWRDRLPERWFWAGLAVVGMLYSLGVNAPLFPLVYRLLPGLGWVRVPTRALLVVSLAANLLAALGADRVIGVQWSAKARRWATRIAFAGLLTCGGLGIGFALLLKRDVPAAVLSFSVLGAVLMALLLVSLRGSLPVRIGQVVLAVLLLADLWAVARSLLTLRAGEEVFAENAEPAAYLAAQQGTFRVYSPSYSIRYHVGARWGLEQLDGVDGLILAWTAGFMGLAGGYAVPPGYWVTVPVFADGSDMSTALRDAVPDAALLGLLNGRFVVSEFPIDAPDLVLRTRVGSSYVYENDRVLPRAFMIFRTESTASWQDAQSRLAAGFDPAEAALVEGGSTLNGPPGWQPAQISHHSANRIIVEAETTHPALLVLSEIWYPGWHATIDGVEQTIYRVDGIVRGVYLEPGRHVVTWHYRPSSLRWGALLTLLALVGLLVRRYRCRP